MLLWLPRIALFAIVLFAVRKGEEPERLVAAVLLSTFALDAVNHAMFGDPAFYAVNPGHVVIDGWAFMTLLWVALRANRGWPLWISASQVIVVLGHLAKIVDLSLVRYGYWVMTQVPATLQVIVLAIGTFAHMRREARIGRYHSWRMA